MISELASGECRWVGREDVHVYCHAPVGCEARYRVICPAEGLEDYDRWMPLDDAERIVSRILYSDNPRPKKRGARC